MGSRALLLWLDGYDAALAHSLMAEGRLPALQRLHARSARFALDHGTARRTGLAGEHISSGLSPQDAGRFASIFFDPARYTIWQEGSSLVPFPARLPARTVVFDTPYFDLARAPGVRGIVDWGAHDPGTRPDSRPESLRAEIAARFGPYPTEWIYGFVWNSPARAEAMGAALVKGCDLRAEAALWLLEERCPDWDLGIVVSCELHSASEAMWHGHDRTHALNPLPSSAPARKSLLAVYDAVDRLVGRMTDAFPDAALIVCSLHGMGPNRADVPALLLLPELLFRHRFGRPLFQDRPDWLAAANGVPVLRDDEYWGPCVIATMPQRQDWHPSLVKRALPPDDGRPPWPDTATTTARLRIESLPATRYQPFWPAMRAFAVPAYYDGRVRINLAGREARGRVPRWAYRLALNAVERLVRACRDTRTGEPVVDAVERPGLDNPEALGPTGSDLVITWRGSPLGFVHPRLGRIGPVPQWRTGGHTGGHGMAYLLRSGLAPGDYGLRSAFDVVPTVVELMGLAKPTPMSGSSLLAAAAAAPQAAAAE